MSSSKSSPVGYREVYELLQDRIVSGKISGQLPSVAQLSREFGVNHNTITKAVGLLKEYRFVYGLQGKGVFINPDAGVNLLACKRVALYLHAKVMNYPFYIRLVFALRSLLELERCEVNIINSVNQLKAFAGSLDALVIFEEFDAAEMPAVRAAIGSDRIIFCNCPGEDGQLRLGSDNEAGGRIAVEYMYRLGCRHLGLLRVRDFDDSRSHFFLRRSGVHASAHQYTDLKLFEVTIPVAELGPDRELHYGGMLLDQAPDGIILSFDLLAFSIYHCMQQRKMCLPVLGYDDRDFACCFIPGLSSIREDETAVAHEAVRQIREVLGNVERRHYALSQPVLVPRAGTEMFRKL